MTNLNEQKGSILIVDDNANNLRLLNTLLTDKGHQVRPAPNGKLALSGAKAIPPDLILLDIMMPEMDGYEVCRQLKQDVVTKDIPIIFLTARSETQDVVKAFQMGAVDYLTKPFCHEELISRVQTHLNLKFIREALQVENLKKNELLQVLTHDIRNQVTANLGFWRIIAETANPTDEHKKIMTRGLENSVDIVDLVLKMNALEDNKQELDIIPNNLKTMIMSSSNILEEKMACKNIVLNIDIHEQTNVLVESISFVNSVINNLLTNALKFSFNGSEIKIFERDCQKENGVNLVIRDFGIGMPKTICDNVFKFQKKTNRLGTEGEFGTGYGLPLVKKFVDLYGGSISIKSWEQDQLTKKHGTEITLQLNRFLQDDDK